jgi:hypothetical protein
MNRFEILYKTDDEEKVLNLHSLARSFNASSFAYFLSEFLNQGGKQLRAGITIGEELRTAHRSLQRCAVAFCLGVIVGISDQEYTDPRNETAIRTAKQIKTKLATDELALGPYL